MLLSKIALSQKVFFSSKKFNVFTILQFSAAVYKSK